MTAKRTFETRRLKHVVELQRIRADVVEGPYVGLENIESWTGRLKATPDTVPPSEDPVDDSVGQSQTNSFQSGDILFGKLRPYLAKAWVADFGGRCTTEALVMRAERVEPRYLLYVLLQPSFVDAVDSSTYGSKMPRAEWDFIGTVPVPVPPRAAQRAIVDFLDAEVGEIDALAAAKQRVLDLLAERRKAIIATAVTRGLDPKVTLHDSGVPWLGEIPAHWEIERARWLFRERDVRSTTGEEEMLTVSHLTGVTPRSEKDVNMFEAETNEGYKLCEPGDLVINTLWAWMGAMGIAPVKGIVSPAYNIYKPGPRLTPSYVDALARLPVFAQEVTRYSKGVWSSRLRLYPEGFFEVYLPVPPKAEQQAIAKHIARESEKLDAVLVATERTIGLLKERRSALIAAAVTGQLDVRAAA
ncbi:MAG: restriction endonuclease subunit S [Gammaproteobacteria bacterium]|nr:MAG: restriction endonuclease subunit S [Gammaproteobacteria bacterium]